MATGKSTATMGIQESKTLKMFAVFLCFLVCAPLFIAAATAITVSPSIKANYDSKDGYGYKYGDVTIFYNGQKWGKHQFFRVSGDLTTIYECSKRCDNIVKRHIKNGKSENSSIESKTNIEDMIAIDDAINGLLNSYITLIDGKPHNIW